MPLFEVRDDELVPFRRVPFASGLYEEEIEDLFWSNLDAFVGVPLFPVARQRNISGGLRPDIVTLDEDGYVHVIEVKRDIARDQLAQCLEYAGWALDTSLDELAAMFHDGEDAFFEAWTEFTDSDSPQLVQQPPRLVLVARDFDDRTGAALRYLAENGLPITVLRVTVYQDRDNRRFVDVDADHEPEVHQDGSGDGSRAGRNRHMLKGRSVVVKDLLDEGLIAADTPLTWTRPQKEKSYTARVLDTGDIKLDDGRIYSSPSRAACEAAGTAVNGWRVWKTPSGRTLLDLRSELLGRHDPSG
ncbi:hypothetical protein [Candidatus Spongiisocius sp.]|uniref:restriction system modified-DNA reader domain-containing protein n=1 Tax=Candidatus Spongiisocius sp. TaxID=3101273 RepID=UPI003B5AE5DA